ncbi:MAG: hypothetical protein WCR52_10295 [Bacteroidota bacterium]|uniref:hypothetical protein n=1 Tax=Runella sp. TaxID=1960881 RepID=UPI0030195D41
MVTTLSNAQLEILKLFASDLSDAELKDLRRLLIDFRYRRLQQALDQLHLSPEEIKEWAEGHDRTPYGSQNGKQEPAA